MTISALISYKKCTVLYGTKTIFTSQHNNDHINGKTKVKTYVTCTIINYVLFCQQN